MQLQLQLMENKGIIGPRYVRHQEVTIAAICNCRAVNKCGTKKKRQSVSAHAEKQRQTAVHF